MNANWTMFTVMLAHAFANWLAWRRLDMHAVRIFGVASSLLMAAVFLVLGLMEGIQ